VITPPPGLRGAVVLGVAAQHNVRPREPHFMRAVTALRELDIHAGANYVHTKPEEDAAETWREEDGAYYYNPGSNKVRAAPHQPRAAARRAAPAEQQAPRSIIWLSTPLGTRSRKQRCDTHPSTHTLHPSSVRRVQLGVWACPNPCAACCTCDAASPTA
jgi:hypothetical protein